MQDTLWEMLQRHLLLCLHFIVPADQVQDEDGWDRLGVSCHQAAKLGFQRLLAPLKEGFLAQNSTRIEGAQGFYNQPQVFLHKNILSEVFLTTVKWFELQAPTTPVTKRLLK